MEKSNINSPIKITNKNNKIRNNKSVSLSYDNLDK